MERTRLLAGCSQGLELAAAFGASLIMTLGRRNFLSWPIADEVPAIFRAVVVFVHGPNSRDPAAFPTFNPRLGFGLFGGRKEASHLVVVFGVAVGVAEVSRIKSE